MQERRENRAVGFGSRKRSRRKSTAILALLLAASFVITGCRTPETPRPVSKPAQHSIRAEQFLVLSDFRLSKEHPLIADLSRLKRRVVETLNLPAQRDEVVVYLFENEEAYRSYLSSAYPSLPRRRAYFVGTPYELAIYTFWGERIREDLRHEYTHGLLHASLESVPLWLDEGLAEYFESPGENPERAGDEQARRLAEALKNGWQPDLARLERLEEFSQMQRVDYQESWAWVHYLLNHSAETREVLLGYLEDLRRDRPEEDLAERLRRRVPGIERQLIGYIGRLNARAVARAQSGEKGESSEQRDNAGPEQ